jgi:kynurenine formamidase
LKSYYLSYFINKNTPQYGGDDAILISQRSTISKGDSSNSKNISMPNHVGTHIDFPRHFSINGKTINDYSADYWFFDNPYVLNYPAREEEIINFGEKFRTIPKATDILLINTGFQKYRGTEKYWKFNPGLSPDLAGKLRKECPKLKAVGFDFISLSSYQNRILGREAHKQFLVEHDILIIEDMDFSLLRNKVSQLIAIPLMIDEADGSPVTVLAR